MNCRRMEFLLSSRLDGHLSSQERSVITAHVRDCSSCRRLEEEFIALGAAARELPAPLAADDLERRIAERWIAEHEASPANARPSFPPRSSWARCWRLARPPFAWAAVLLLTLLGVRLVRMERSRPWGTKSPAVVIASPSRIAALAPRSAPLRSQNDPSPRLATRDLILPRPLNENHSRFPFPDNRGVVSGSGSNRPPRAHPGPLSWSASVDDLVYLNRDSEAAIHGRVPLQQDEWEKIEARVHREVRVRDDFVTIPFPRLASTSERQIAQAVESYKREAAIVDPRLSHEVTCAFKATALSDLCDRLRADTEIQLTAGSSVADQKVTLFCENVPLREVMRQLARPFGYTWLRSGRGTREAGRGQYRYELVQDLKSQLMEEELRNRDRREALLALDREMQRYRPYLGLSPEAALARSRTARPEEKRLLENLAGDGWGVVQMYFRLSPDDLAALRSGMALNFSVEPKVGEQPLPQELADGVKQSLREWRVEVKNGRVTGFSTVERMPNGMPIGSVPEARLEVNLSVDARELSHCTLSGGSGLRAMGSRVFNTEVRATGISPSVRTADNRAANARVAADPALQRRISILPGPSFLTVQEPGPQIASPGETREARVTSADVLEALHQASGLSIVADFYTRLYRPSAVSARNQALFEALNSVSDGMRVHWKKEGGWLQFRSTSYYDDRLKEVPNRLLNRWAASRRQHGGLPLTDLLEISQLPPVQLDSSDMADGARECFGLTEWDLARREAVRRHGRYLIQLTPEQWQQAQTPVGLSFGRMTHPQQQELLQQMLPPNAAGLPTSDALAAASLRVEYSQPGWYRWAVRHPSDLSGDQTVLPSPVREQTRDAALQAARRLDPNVSEEEIAPAELALRVQFSLRTRQTGSRTFMLYVTPRSTIGRSYTFPPGAD